MRIFKGRVIPQLSTPRVPHSGRNNTGKITTRHQGGGNKNRLRLIDYKRGRKDIPATIFGFLRFKEQHKDSLLYLHMNPKDPLGYDLPAIFSQTPLIEGEDYMFPPKTEENHLLPIEKLNLIYNSLN